MILQRIKKSNGSPVAFIMDKGNGVQCIQKLNGSVLGWHRPSPTGGRTTDRNGSVIAQGNVLTSLITDLL
ncbi:MAG: hypothetical protein ACXWTT_00900 [Methylobacter sp.]